MTATAEQQRALAEDYAYWLTRVTPFNRTRDLARLKDDHPEFYVLVLAALAALLPEPAPEG